jgi:curved DNA-binding protein CbpA
MRGSRDFYATLGVSSTADDAAIKQAWRTLAMQWHPDKNRENIAEAEARFKEIGEAYLTLRDPDTRARYDREREEAARPPRPPPKESRSFYHDPFDFGGFRGFGGFSSYGYDSDDEDDFGGFSPFGRDPDVDLMFFFEMLGLFDLRPGMGRAGFGQPGTARGRPDDRFRHTETGRGTRSAGSGQTATGRASGSGHAETGKAKEGSGSGDTGTGKPKDGRFADAQTTGGTVSPEPEVGRGQPLDPLSVHIVGLKRTMSPSDIRKAFSRFGTVTNVYIIPTQPHKGFVSFTTKGASQTALGQRNIVVNGDRVGIKPALWSK